jgi:hypothetical protein
MDARTRTETIVFHHAFRLKSVAATLPAGAYTMHVEEEMIDGLSFPAWRRTTATITPQGLAAGRLLQSWSVLPAELEAALDADAKASP